MLKAISEYSELSGRVIPWAVEWKASAVEVLGLILLAFYSPRLGLRGMHTRILLMVHRPSMLRIARR